MDELTNTLLGLSGGNTGVFPIAAQATEQATETDLERELMGLLSRYPVTNAGSTQTNQGQTQVAEAPIINTPAEALNIKKHAKEDQINQNFNSLGIRAFTDAKGQLVLTNSPVATDAETAMRPWNIPNSKEAQGFQTNVDAIRNAPNRNDAFALALNQIENIRQQRVKIEDTVRSQLEQSRGVDKLRQQAAFFTSRGLANDPNVARLNTALNAMEDQINQEVGRSLQRNVRYGQLVSQEKLIATEAERQAKRADALEDFQIRRDLAAEDKKDEKREVARSENAIIKQRLAILNPSVQTSADPELSMFNEIRKIQQNPEMKAAVTATDENLPYLASLGNQYATEILVSQESSDGKADPLTVRNRLKEVKSYSDPKKIMTDVMNIIPSWVEGASKKQQEFTQRAQAILAKERTATTKGEKEDIEAEKAMLAWDAYRQSNSARYIGNLSGIKTGDKAFLEAVGRSAEKYKKTDLRTVFDEYMGPNGTVEMAQTFEQIILNDMELTSKSVFGKPSSLLVKEMINQEWLRRVRKETAGYAGTLAATNPFTFR